MSRSTSSGRQVIIVGGDSDEVGEPKDRQGFSTLVNFQADFTMDRTTNVTVVDYFNHTLRYVTKEDNGETDTRGKGNGFSGINLL
jgi:hypothetical protein